MISLSPERELLGFLLLGSWAGYIAYRLEYRHAPLWVYGYLALKMLSAWAFGWIYQYYYCYGDTLRAYATVGRIWHYLIYEPATGIALLLREFSPDFEEVGWRVYYRDLQIYDYDYDYVAPVSYRFIRLLLPFYVAVGGGYYGMQGLMGLVSGLLWYGACKRWQAVLPVRGTWLVVWMLLPSGLFWGSGVLRDSLALPLLLYLSGWMAGLQKRPSPKDLFWGLAGGLVLGLIRPEGMLLAIAVGLGYWLPWQKLWLWGLSAGLMWLLLWLGAERACAYRAYWLSPKERPEILEGAHVFEIDCQSGIGGSLWSWMQGVWYGLTGPYLWQAHRGVVFLSALEMLGLWLFAGIRLWQGRRKWRWHAHSLFLIAAGVSVVGVAAMLMPFWGALARQRLYGLYLLWLGLTGLEKGAENETNSLS